MSGSLFTFPLEIAYTPMGGGEGVIVSAAEPLHHTRTAHEFGPGDGWDSLQDFAASAWIDR